MRNMPLNSASSSHCTSRIIRLLTSEMTCIVSGGALNSTHSITALLSTSNPVSSPTRTFYVVLLQMANKHWGPIFEKSCDEFMITNMLIFERSHEDFIIILRFFRKSGPSVNNNIFFLRTYHTCFLRYDDINYV